MRKASENHSVFLCHLVKDFRPVPQATEIATDFQFTPVFSESEIQEQLERGQLELNISRHSGM